VYPWSAIREATVLLTESGLAALPVVDDEDRVVGVVSETDVLARGLDEPDDDVGRVMTPAAEVVSVDTDVTSVVKRMLRHRLRCVPVVENGVLIGVIGRSDLLRVLVRDDDVIATRVRRDLADYAGSRRRWQVTVVRGTVLVVGEFIDEAERGVVVALARTVPGVTAVELVHSNVAQAGPGARPDIGAGMDAGAGAAGPSGQPTGTAM